MSMSNHKKQKLNQMRRPGDSKNSIVYDECALYNFTRTHDSPNTYVYVYTEWMNEWLNITRIKLTLGHQLQSHAEYETKNKAIINGESCAVVRIGETVIFQFLMQSAFRHQNFLTNSPHTIPSKFTYFR